MKRENMCAAPHMCVYLTNIHRKNIVVSTKRRIFAMWNSLFSLPVEAKTLSVEIKTVEKRR